MWVQGEATCPSPSSCLRDSSPSTSRPLSPHHQTLEKLFQNNPWTWRSSSDQLLDLEKLFRPILGPGEAFQTNPWTWRSSSDQPLDISLLSSPAAQHISACKRLHARKELPSPSHSPRTWLTGSISFSQKVRDATRARVSPLLSSHHARSVCPVGKSRPKTRW